MKPLIFGLLFILPFNIGYANSDRYIDRPEVQAYIKQFAKQHNYDRDTLNRLFGTVDKQDKAIEALDRPYEAKPWYVYRKIFLTKARIAQGVMYWHQNRQLLERVSQHYKVPVEIILALMGVETVYGKITGTYPVFDTLVTLGFDYPKREKFFRQELTQFLLLCREEGIDCRQSKGSHAGAMGVGQFISSSYRRYAVDFDGDGKRDLWSSKADVIASIANYIAKHGWVYQGPVADKIQLQGSALDGLLNEHLKPWLDLADLKKDKIDVQRFKPRSARFTLLGMQTEEDGKELWAGYQNFYVISRYNHSRLYALAVYLLSEEIKKSKNR